MNKGRNMKSLTLGNIVYTLDTSASPAKILVGYGAKAYSLKYGSPRYLAILAKFESA